MSGHDCCDPVWEHEALSRVFQVAFAPDVSPPCMYMPELAAELTADGLDARLAARVADRVLVARLELEHASECSFDFLLGAWTRCCMEERAAHAAPAATALAGVRRLIAGYLGLVVQIPDMFPRGEKNGTPVSPHALVPSLMRLGTPAAPAESLASPLAGTWPAVPGELAELFVSDLVARFPLGDGLDEVVGAALYEITQEVSRGSSAAQGTAAQGSAGARAPGVSAEVPPASDPLTAMLQLLTHDAQPASPGYLITDPEWRPCMMTISTALGLKPLAAAVPFLASFSPPTSAAALERDALMLPLVRLSCLPDAYPNIAREQFDGNLGDETVAQNMDAMRLALEVVQSENFRMWDAMVRAGAEPRERILRLWGRICDMNHRRAAMHVVPGENSSDAFMVNMTDMLLRFSAPFIDSQCTKIGRIDTDYMRRQQRWNTRALTRLRATESEAGHWLDTAPTEAYAPNFVTEAFFLTARFVALGVVPVMRRMDERDKDRQRLQDRMHELEDTRFSWENTPSAPHYHALLQRMRTQLGRLKSNELAVQTVLLDMRFLVRTIAFTTFMMAWLVRMAEPRTAFPQLPVQLPLPPEAPEQFRMLPEHLFDDACDVVLFYARRCPDLIDAAASESIVVFCIVFIASTSYVQNPFLKAKVAELLAYCLMPFGQHTSGLLGDVLNVHPLALEHLVPALVTFWIEAESTGSSTQFYDKFNIRYHLSFVFKTIWENPAHTARLHRVANEQPAHFVVFINRVMNDVTFLLDDALEKLQEIHDGEAAEASPTWQSQSSEQLEAHSSRMHTYSMQARSDLALGSVFLDLLIGFARETPRMFMTPEIVDRLAAMLDYNLDTLVGPRCQGLRLRNAHAVGFDPKRLLKRILSMYTNLAECPEFPRAIARDGRSFRAELFERASRIATRHMLKSPAELEALAALVQRALEARQAEVDEEEDLGEIPEDYLDPVMATLMHDPVILPSSRKVVDRSTICAHLLNDGSDPFNRMPLKLEDVQPADALRAEIEAWLAEKRAAARSRVGENM